VTVVRPLALGLLVLVLLAGLGAAGYLVAHHENQVYGDATLTLANCPETATVNCDLVNSSSWSELAGVPIAAFAIPTYLLLLLLVAMSPRTPATLAYAFGIGVLAVSYSIALFVISKTQIGFLCLWCMRLYAVNLSIPILSALAARRSPVALVTTALRDLRVWPRPMRTAAAAFVALFLLTVAGDRFYRGHVRAVAAAERLRIEQEGGPTVPAVPPDAGGAPAPKESSSLFGGLVPEAHAAAPAGPYQLAGPLRRIEQSPSGVKSAAFDLQARLGKGKPIALLFFAPGFPWSQRTLVETAAFLRKETPQIELYAVSGLRAEQRDEEILETFSMLGIPAGLPLLVDDHYTVTKGLGISEVPDIVLFSAKGQLVIGLIQDRAQIVITATGNRPAEEVFREVAKGAEVSPVQKMFPYYPSQRLLDRCAPAFKAKVFGSGAPFSFSGRSTSGRPTLVMFWSSTCKHCQVDIPKLVAWVNAHPGKVDVIGVTNIRKDLPGQPSHRAITEAYIRAQHIPWPVVEDVGGAVQIQYASISTPTTLFVSPSGAVQDIWYYAHDEGFDAAMDKSLAKTAGAAGACRAPDVLPSAKLAFSVMGADDKRVELASQLTQPALVHLWATWCKPCVAELPSLLRFKQSVEKDGGARVVLVSVEAEADGKRIKDFAKTLGVDFRSFRAPKGGTAAAVDLAYRVPRTFVVGPGGQVLDVLQGSQEWGDAVVTDPIRARLSAAGGAAR